MKLPIRLTKISLLALLFMFGLLGAYVASLTYQYQIMVRAILGLAVLCLIFLYGASSRIDGSVEALLAHVKIRDFIRAFIWTLLSYWAARQIIEAILSLVKT